MKIIKNQKGQALAEAAILLPLFLLLFLGVIAISQREENGISALIRARNIAFYYDRAPASIQITEIELINSTQVNSTSSAILQTIRDQFIGGALETDLEEQILCAMVSADVSLAEQVALPGLIPALPIQRVYTVSGTWDTKKTPAQFKGRIVNNLP